ncbi:MAG: tripartite tricarboxylate transporter TctB family protein [Microbacteriaceae bacterium]
MQHANTDESVDEPDVVGDSAGATRRNLILGIFWIVFGILTFIGASVIEIYQGTPSQELGPKFWPQMMGALFIVVGIILVIQSLRGKAKDPEMEPTTRSGLIESAIVVAILIVQTILWGYFGFLIPSILALIAVPLALGSRKYITILLFSFGTAGLLYGLFALLLRIPL